MLLIDLHSKVLAGQIIDGTFDAPAIRSSPSGGFGMEIFSLLQRQGIAVFSLNP
jgi:hypothetical protein